MSEWSQRLYGETRESLSREEVLAALSFEMEFPFSEDENEMEFIEYLNTTHDNIVTKTEAWMANPALDLKCRRLMAEAKS